MNNITLIPELIITIGDVCDLENQQLKIKAEVQISSEQHEDGYTELTGVSIHKIISVDLCENRLNASAHDAIQMWLEKDFVADMKQSALYAAVIDRVDG
tara:strand:+ start:229 stop:525 length:297 start_codon:yes stop_codon:yes gene_type:complete